MTSYIGGKSEEEIKVEQKQGKLYVLRNLGWTEVKDSLSFHCLKDFNPIRCLSKLYGCLKDKICGCINPNS